MGVAKINIFKVLLGGRDGVTKKEYSVYALDNVDNYGWPLIFILNCHFTDVHVHNIDNKFYSILRSGDRSTEPLSHPVDAPAVRARSRLLRHAADDRRRGNHHRHGDRL